ncbi:hypothetical protein JNUCC0626_19880 [Lentzea sp. JNUCC 0626]|uniref:hypothetical protein n=1 Tax=Lentzea sp. JNUCC 0626 TaxID=3367513 RepID=UPI00374827F5
MTHDECKAYAAALLVEHAGDVELLSVYEMFEQHGPDGCGDEISDEDAGKVFDLVATANITVHWT